MELVDRYLQAARFWLPRKQKDDISAELAGEIRSQIDEEESRLGRRLVPAEVAGILKRLGNPLVVAQRYLPQRYLIGPVWFPLYVFVLKIVGVCVVAPWLVGWLALMVKAVFGGVWAGRVVATMFISLWPGLLIAFGMVTLGFAALERMQARWGCFKDWDPRKLPALRVGNQSGRGSTAFELAVNFVVLTWFATNLASPVVLNRPEIRVTFTSEWRDFFWGFLAVVLANIGNAAANLLRPHWAGTRATVRRLTTDCLGGALFCLLLRANMVASVAGRGMTPEQGARATAMVNSIAASCFPYAFLFAVAVAAADIYRILRVRRNRRAASLPSLDMPAGWPG